MVKEMIIPGIAAVLAAACTFAVFQYHISSHRRMASQKLDDDAEAVDSADDVMVPLLADDRFWASLLCSAAVFMHYYYY